LAAIQRPEALRNTVEYTFAQTNKPGLVTENGLETVMLVASGTSRRF